PAAPADGQGGEQPGVDHGQPDGPTPGGPDFPADVVPEDFRAVPGHWSPSATATGVASPGRTRGPPRLPMLPPPRPGARGRPPPPGAGGGAVLAGRVPAPRFYARAVSCRRASPSRVRQAPGGRSPSPYRPMATRTSRRTRWPTADNIRRTCRLRPSV